MLDESLKTIRNGEVVEGTVIDVKQDEIILNIGYKVRRYHYQVMNIQTNRIQT